MALKQVHKLLLMLVLLALLGWFGYRMATAQRKPAPIGLKSVAITGSIASSMRWTPTAGGKYRYSA